MSIRHNAVITSDPWGTLPDGRPVTRWSMRGHGGMEIRVLDLGGIVTDLMVPDASGDLADVVLGFPCLSDYLAHKFYFGCIVGRVAGRITGARFSLDGISYDLAANDPPNHAHGGVEGFDSKLWEVQPGCSESGDPCLILSYHSADGEEGYPGNVDVRVTYTLSQNNQLLIESEATTDQATPFSLTHHSYFNLGGEGAGTIENHELQIFADHIVPTDSMMTLSGRAVAVETGASDFRDSRRLKDAIPRLFQNHGDLYLLARQNPPHPTPRLAARLRDPRSGRNMDVRTSESCLQLYTGKFLHEGLIGKSGRNYAPYAGLCLECEGYPDGVHTRAFGDIILRPGQTFQQSTSYHFTSNSAQNKNLPHEH